MSVTKLLKESEKWLKQAEKSIVIKKPPKEPRVPFDDFVKQRGEEIRARIDTLKGQRDASIKRYDNAIAEQENELKRLEEEIRPPDTPEPDR